MRRAKTVSIRTRSFDRVMPDYVRRYVAISEVSIRTRSFDRVMPVSRCCIDQIRREGFNPHPVFRPGDAASQRAEIVGRLVSIRTRSFDRVMQRAAKNS